MQWHYKPRLYITRPSQRSRDLWEPLLLAGNRNGTDRSPRSRDRLLRVRLPPDQYCLQNEGLLAASWLVWRVLLHKDISAWDSEGPASRYWTGPAAAGRTSPTAEWRQWTASTVPGQNWRNWCIIGWKGQLRFTAACPSWTCRQFFL